MKRGGGGVRVNLELSHTHVLHEPQSSDHDNSGAIEKIFFYHFRFHSG